MGTRRTAIPRPETIPNAPTEVLPEPSPPAPSPIDGNGEARGCRSPDSISIGVPGISFLQKGVGGVIPSWVQATSTPSAAPDQSPRILEGRLEDSRITKEDFPLKPWHTYYDWNFYVRADPQYGGLLSVANDPGIMECEWDSAFFPEWAWPQRGQRIWMAGRWIFDCGHPDDDGNCRTEIHPPKAVVSFRTEGVKFKENAKSVRATQAVVYIGRKGGYWTSPINDMDYVFRIPLPPKPDAATAKPVWKIESKTGARPVEPQITIYPPPRVLPPTTVGNAPAVARRTRAALPLPPKFPVPTPTALDVRIPLKGLSPHPDEYGVVISAGWTDPGGVEAKKIIPLNVKIETIFMDANLDSLPFDSDEWYVYVCINGRWRVYKSLNGESESLNHSVNLDLTSLEKISISVCGFEADTLHDLMGSGTSVAARQVSSRGTNAEAKAVASAIRNKFVAALPLGLNENDGISTMFIQEPVSAATRTVVRRSESNDYRLKYTIKRRS